MSFENEDSPERKKCNKMLIDAVLKNKTIQFLVNAIESKGCVLPEAFIVCRSCPDNEISGGFAVDPPSLPYKPMIVVCDNKNLDKVTFENTIVHELIHAYDKCRAKVDFSNCLHHACTEVRASSLSGECDYAQEIRRGHVTFQKGHQNCVTRRALKSVSSNPNCQESLAGQALHTVFRSCYKDTAPFESPR